MHRLLRIIETAARWVFFLTIAFMFVCVMCWIYLRLARVPTSEITQKIPSWYSRQHISWLSLSPALRSAARRAQIDHFVDPVPELREKYHWRFVTCNMEAHRGSDDLFVVCFPSFTDCDVVYRCTPDGKLLWKAYDDHSS
jgi:hypothetical protein